MHSKAGFATDAKLSRRNMVAAGLTITVLATLAVTLTTKWIQRGPDDVPGPIRVELSAKVVPILETHPDADALLGHTGGGRACAVRPFGTEPPAVSRAEHVTTVYAWASCATLNTDVRSEASGPVVIRLTPAISIEVAGDGTEYGKAVRRMFPKRLQDLAFEHSDNQQLEQALEERIRELN